MSCWILTLFAALLFLSVLHVCEIPVTISLPMPATLISLPNSYEPHDCQLLGHIILAVIVSIMWEKVMA
jgi:hypothetical protein